MPADKNLISVLGAGSWGTALAVLMAGNGNHVRLWSHDGGQLAAMQEQRSNAAYLPGVYFPQDLALSDDLAGTAGDSADLLIAVPSQGFRGLLESLFDKLPDTARIAWASKGLESPDGRLLHEVAHEVLGDKYPVAVISGPTFAMEVVKGQPAAIAIASQDEAFATDLRERLHNGTFRAYTNNDLMGVQVGGAVKNVLAIAAGIADGLGYGANSRAALVTRGLAEMCRFGIAMGARAETLTGLAGLGDLVLTCTDDQSRNRRLGIALAQGSSVSQAEADIGQVVEGVHTAAMVVQRAQQLDIEMPITEQVDHVLSGRMTPEQTVQNLLSRAARQEAT